MQYIFEMKFPVGRKEGIFKSSGIVGVGYLLLVLIVNDR